MASKTDEEKAGKPVPEKTPKGDAHPQPQGLHGNPAHDQKTQQAPEQDPKLQEKRGIPAGAAPGENQDDDQAQKLKAAAGNDPTNAGNPNKQQPVPQHASEAAADNPPPAGSFTQDGEEGGEKDEGGEDQGGETAFNLENADAGSGDIYLDGPADQLPRDKDAAEKMFKGSPFKVGGMTTSSEGRTRITLSRG